MEKTITDYGNLIGVLINTVILILLGIATLYFVLKSLGWLPDSIEKFLERKDLRNYETLFYQYGITPSYYFKKMKSLALLESIDKNIVSLSLNNDEIKKALKELIKERTFIVNLLWGTSSPSNLKYYIDLQGVCLDASSCKKLAEFIAYKIKSIVKERLDSPNPFLYDCIAVHENAAPFLGYEVSNMLNIPVLYIKSEYTFSKDEKILNALEVSQDRRNFLHNGIELKNAIFVADLLMLAPHIKQVRDYLAQFGISLSDCFLIAFRNDRCTLEDLKNEQINVHAYHEINDKILSNWLKK